MHLNLVVSRPGAFWGQDPHDIFFLQIGRWAMRGMVVGGEGDVGRGENWVVPRNGPPT